MHRDQIVAVRVNQRERQRWQEAARREDLRLSEWLRLVVREALRDEPARDEDRSPGAEGR